MAAYMTVDAFAAEIQADDMTVRRMIDKGLIKGVINIALPGAKRARLRIPATEIKRIGQDLALGARTRRRSDPKAVASGGEARLLGPDGGGRAAQSSRGG